MPKRLAEEEERIVEGAFHGDDAKTGLRERGGKRIRKKGMPYFGRSGLNI